MARESKNLLVALDIGTSKVVAIVAELLPDGRLDIIGMGGHESKGLKKGVVVNIEATVNAIQRTLEEAELMADCKIERVFTGIAGSHIKSFNSTGMVAIKDKEVTPVDVERAIETARAMPIPTDQQVLHILTQEFIIDGQDGVREPLGMSGVRLEVKVHIVTGAVSAAQNIVKCVRRCGLEVNDLILQPLASSFAVLTEDEKELGVCLVDIGGGTSDIAVFREGAIRARQPSDRRRSDHERHRNGLSPTAEPRNSRSVMAARCGQLAEAGQMIEVAGVGDRPPRMLSRQTLAEVIEPRVEELYSLIQQVLRDSGYEELLSSGIVLTGGSAVMQGMAELGEEIFHMPVRLGIPAIPASLGCGPQPALRHRHRAAARGSRPDAARTDRAPGRFDEASVRKDAPMVPTQFLNAPGMGDQQGGVPPRSTSPKDAPTVPAQFPEGRCMQLVFHFIPEGGQYV
jgi:cell division protein FtsA